MAGVIAYFPVDDVDAAVSAAQDLGASLVIEPWEIPGLGRMALVTDPEGNRVGLMSQLSKDRLPGHLAARAASGAGMIPNTCGATSQVVGERNSSWRRC